MIDYFALGLTHVLIVIALLRIFARAQLDREDELVDPPAEPARVTPREARRQRRRKGGGDA
ncbi:hypothetical protein K3181_08175 [Qipengyuania sp. YG27]|uniref:Uncharacterized protein n=1 Tax=Qipengyuania mesophila TaxID=2867246 RepID=A0ABS7JUS9_9SPHN|nr:hypothetical protein [Qipengyuania mesophila]MBX7501415.1 hypothetical protein [Qipengyuania mesophila]